MGLILGLMCWPFACPIDLRCLLLRLSLAYTFLLFLHLTELFVMDLLCCFCVVAVFIRLGGIYVGLGGHVFFASVPFTSASVALCFASVLFTSASVAMCFASVALCFGSVPFTWASVAMCFRPVANWPYL